MPQEKYGRRLSVEPWEVKVVKQVVHAYRTDHEELEAELFKRLLDLKLKRHAQVRDWKAFLARSLYNAANNFLRDRNLRECRIYPLERDDEDDAPASLARIIAAPEETIDLRIDLSTLLKQLSPELRVLWDVLVTEEGNVSAAAKRLGRPRKTLEYWIKKLRSSLKSRGLI
jgi:DNA-directed RNA polymerase specialized sigma24 family protein